MKKIGKSFLYLGLGTIAITSIGILNVSADNVSSDSLNNDSIAKVAYSGYVQKDTPYYDSYTSSQPVGNFDKHNHYIVTYYNPQNGRFKFDNNGKTVYINQNDVKNSPQNFNDDYGYQHYTRNELNTVNQTAKQKRYQSPNFEKMNLSDVLSAKDKNGKQLNVWDSWPLRDVNGNEVTYKGYHLVFGLTGGANSSNIYVFYQKIGDENKGISSWKSAGPLFNNVKEGNNNNDSIINKETQQWSGQTVKLSNGDIRLFYTSYNQKNSLKNDENIATAKIALNTNKNGIYVNHKKNSDRRNIFSSDGNNYQTASQVLNSQYDEFALRDPHYFESNGHKYVIFESNTGNKYGYQGGNALHNLANYGGNKSFQDNEQKFLSSEQNSNWAEFAANANGSIGMIELDNNYKIKRTMKPLMGFNTIDDQIERPNLFKHNGKWYLFITTRGSKIASPNIDRNDTYVLGFSSKSPMGPFKPLNKNGLILSSDKNDTNMYSFLILNNKNDNDNDFIVTQYMINPSSGLQTFGKSFLLNINGNSTKVLDNRIMPQGSVSKNNVKYEKQNKN